MNEYDALVSTIALTLGVGWASGLNLYAAVFTLGFLANTGNAQLPPGLEIVSDPMVMGAAGIMYMVEFFTDKVPGVDTGWDALHTFIRIPAGAVLAAAAAGEVSTAAQVAAGLAGGTMAAGSHTLKAGSRALINTSPEPVSNWGASLAEDVAVIGGVWVALNHPWAFLAALVAFVALAIWLLPKIWRGLTRAAAYLGRLLSRREAASEPPIPPDSVSDLPPSLPRDNDPRR